MAEIIADAVDYAVARAPSRTREGLRQSPGQRPGVDNAKSFYYEGAATIWHSGTPETIPPLSEAVVWGTSGTAFDISTSRWISFTVVGSGVHSIAAQQDWAAITAANDAIGIEYHTRGGWRRYQMKGIAATPPFACLGTSPTIALVAGANEWGVSTNTTNGTVDGPLGTNMLGAPTGGVFGPDGFLYFIDQNIDFIRYYNPFTLQVGTTVVSLNRGTGTFYRENAKVFTIGPDGRFYLYLNRFDDTDSPALRSVNPDNSDGSFGYDWSFLDTRLGPASNPFVAPDNSCLYVPVPKSSPYSGFGASSLPHSVLRFGIDGTDGSLTTVTYAAGSGGIPSNQAGHLPNDQGEDVPAVTGQIGNSVNCYVGRNGDLYTLCNQTRMVRWIPKVTGNIRSITNHVPLDSAGNPQAGGYSGDGLPAFTLNDNTPQFENINSAAVDPCKNVFLGDFHFGYGGGTVDSTALIRYVDTDGNLHTLAGQYPDVDNNLPDATPVDALTRTIHDASWIAWGPDGALYVVSAFCDHTNVSCNAIYRIASTH